MNEERKYIVEVGVGTKPFPTQGKRKIGGDEIYIGIDTGFLAKNAKDSGIRSRTGQTKESLDLARERINQRLTKNHRYHLMFADGMEMPFADQSISEVVFVNVFGYDGINYAEDDTEKTAALLTVEASRVLKPGGLITVVEVLTPAMAPFPVLDALMKIAGFKSLTPSKDVESLKQILDYSENPYPYLKMLRLDFTQTRPYSARFQKVRDLKDVFAK